MEEISLAALPVGIEADDETDSCASHASDFSHGKVECHVCGKLDSQENMKPCGNRLPGHWFHYGCSKSGASVSLPFYFCGVCGDGAVETLPFAELLPVAAPNESYRDTDPSEPIQDVIYGTAGSLPGPGSNLLGTPGSEQLWKAYLEEEERYKNATNDDFPDQSALLLSKYAPGNGSLKEIEREWLTAFYNRWPPWLIEAGHL